MEGKWIIEELNLSEKELFDSLTPELYDLTPAVHIEKFLHKKGMSNIYCRHQPTLTTTLDLQEMHTKLLKLI